MVRLTSSATFCKQRELFLNSYAKLNLYLEVLNKRPDNYHTIKTLFERIDLHDEISLKTRQDKRIKIICDEPSVPKDNKNLAYRSAKLLQDRFNLRNGVDIKIKKRIPVGSGLGGGSSNAAGVLLGLNKLWRLKLSQNQLLRLAKKIGSDVPFFIYAHPFALGEERGDKIKPLKTLDKLCLWHILVVPKIRVATAKIYERWDAECSKSGSDSSASRRVTRDRDSIRDKYSKLTIPEYTVKILTLALSKGDLPLAGSALFNSLEIITAKLHPEVNQIKGRLKHLGLNSILMSGSGPAVFGMVSSRKEAASLCRQLKKDNRSWQVFVTRTLKKRF